MKVLTQHWPTNREGQKKPAFTSLVGERGLVLSGEEPLVMVGLPAGQAGGWGMRGVNGSAGLSQHLQTLALGS